jgi:type I restriction enzyme, S subunit
MKGDRVLTGNSQVPEGYKQTEVGVIPEDWNVKPLYDLSEKIMVGIASAATHAYRDRGIVLLRNQNIKPGYLDDLDILHITPEYESRFKNKRLKSGDLLTARTGYPGTTCVVPLNYESAQSFTTLITRPNLTEVDSRFLCCYINSEVGQKFFEQNQIGGGQKNVNAGSLKQLPVPLPPTIAEQNLIASALSDTDALIESLEQLLAKKRQIKQGAMQELLQFKKGWVETRLGNLASISRGASPRPIDNPIWFDENSEIGWVRISDVTKSGIFLNETTQKLSLLGIKSSRFVGCNSLIMSICATVGRPIITAIDVCIHDGFVVFDSLQIDMRFMFYILKSLEDGWSKHGQTGSQMNLNTNLINGTKVSIPESPEEQTAIATILSDMDLEIGAIETKLTKARQLKQGMMHELLTGRIRLIKGAPS